MNPNFVPFGSFPGGIIALLIALIAAGALISIDWSGSDGHGNSDDDVS